MHFKALDKRRDLLTETTLDKRQDNMEQTQKARGTNLFSLEDALRELEDIREEVEETCTATDNVRAVPESAYKETKKHCVY